MNIVGLGNCGCNIAQEFEKYPQYEVFCIDTEPRQAKNSYVVPKQKSPEQYEANFPSIDHWLNCSGEVIFILGGSGALSAASLRILESLKGCKITVVYIKSDPALLGEVGRLQQRATFYILQEYARSGVFEQIFLIDNSCVGDIIGDVSIADYYHRINQTIVPIIHFINVFDNSEAVMSTFHSFSETSRIRTLGMVNVDTGEEKMLFSLDNSTETRYYYAIGGESLKGDDTLNSKIRSQMRGRNGRTSFGIFETTYADNFCYSLICSREIVQL